MSAVYAVRPGKWTIEVACPRNCGNDQLEVTHVEANDRFETPSSCAACDENVRQPFTREELCEIERRATKALEAV
jgi:hypothetical protein